MSRKKHPALKDKTYGAGAAFVTYNPNSEQGIQQANAAAKNILGSYQLIRRHSSEAYGRDRYEDISTNISVRNEFTRQDYEYFRLNERIPVKPKDIQLFAMLAYRRVGLLRNIIDLMADFGSQGVRLTHPVPAIERFYNDWFENIVCGPDRSERFLNILYRIGTVVAQRTMGKIPLKVEKKMRSKGATEKVKLKPDDDGNIVEYQVEKRTIPTKYTYLNPLILELIGGPVGQFVGKSMYAIKIPANLRHKINTPRNDLERKLIANIPADIKNAVKNGDLTVPLDQDKLCVAHYKKDDWQEWADPMTYPIFSDLLMLEKMKLADLAALDGAISQVRVWTLGDLEKGILPTDEAIETLGDILLSNPGGGAFDLIWGPDLKMQEYKTNIHEFLGNEKYVPVLNAIYEGVGVPPTLTGSADSGATNNYISLKTLIQRLEYGRSKLREFWKREIKLVQDAMGFSKPATIEFDNMVLTDEDSEKKLIIELWDRNLVPDETLQNWVGKAEYIQMKKKREERERERESRQPKAGPYFNAEKEHDLVKTALSRGYIHPEATSITLEDTDEVAPFYYQLQSKNATGDPSQSKSKTGKVGQGRPKGSKDSTKRNRTFKPQSGKSAAYINTVLWAQAAQKQIADIVNPILLNFYKKPNIRSLTSEQKLQASLSHSIVLANLEPFEEITAQRVKEILSTNLHLPAVFSHINKKFTKVFIDKHQREPSVEEARYIQASTYAVLKGEYQDG